MSERHRLHGPTSAVDTCARQLASLGIPEGAVDCRISWYGAGGFPAERPGSESAIQALSGLMCVHGRDQRRPRRIGLDVASTAAGLLAAQAVLAALVGRRRGGAFPSVETSVLQAGLLLVSHYVAIATSPGGFPPVPARPEPGPPFRSVDGHWFEMETLDPEAWRSFWLALGAGGADLGAAWTLFRLRYIRGACALPAGLHEATARHTLAHASEVAETFGVSLCRLRTYSEVVAERSGPPPHPVLEPLAANGPGTVLPASRRPPGACPGDELPLSGILVVEATNRVQGPLAGQLLRMLGADVVLVEPPGRDVGRLGVPQAGDTGAVFLCLNRGKQSVELDLASPSGRSALLDLAAGADAFLHNWRPGKATEWSLEFEDLTRVNPRLVYAGASGWGRGHPSSHLIGTEFMVQAYAGLGNGINPEDEPPLPTRALVTDYTGALMACEGVLAGLYRSLGTGRGVRVDTSLLAAATALQAPVVEALAAGREEGRREGRPLWGPLDRPLDTAEGFLALQVDDDVTLRRLCSVVDVPHEEPARHTTESRLAEGFAVRPAADWEDLLLDGGIPCSVVCTDFAALPADPRLSSLFEPLGGTSHAPASPWRFTP